MSSVIRFAASVSLLLSIAMPHAYAQTPPEATGRHPAQAAQLERLYTLIQSRYVSPQRLEPLVSTVGLDLERWLPALPDPLERRRLNGWSEVRDYSRDKLRRASSEAEAESVLEAMVQWLADDHSVYLSPARAQQVKARFGGSIPCLNYSGQAEDTTPRALETRLEGRVGVVVLPDLLGFDRTARMRSALLELRAQGAAAFVIDLRGNPGGQLIDMMGLGGLFSRGILWRLNLRGIIFPYPIPALGTAEFGEPLAFVVDGQVNSAAEGLSGGLQAVGRARVFGTRSAGNVEAVYPYCLPGGAIAFIASGSLSPWRGAGWEGRGVIPDGEGGLEGALQWASQQIGR